MSRKQLEMPDLLVISPTASSQSPEDYQPTISVVSGENSFLSPILISKTAQHFSCCTSPIYAKLFEATGINYTDVGYCKWPGTGTLCSQTRKGTDLVRPTESG